MGKRKSTKAPVAVKKKPKVDSGPYRCPYCNHDKSVKCTLNHKESRGKLKCSRCDTEYETDIHRLMAPIDVYVKWMDACERANDRAGSDASSSDDEGAPAPLRPVLARPARSSE
ncbi:unnamed protein product [Pedinophyceae sp. YPF-701]|nr:unnamed protein product [Pedinophyceae sp. YPF-701]